LRLVIAVLLLCAGCIVVSYREVQTIDYFFLHADSIRCASPLLVVGVSAALLFIFRVGRVYSVRQKLIMAILVGITMLFSYQIFNYQRYLHSTWETISSALKEPRTNYRTTADLIYARWGNLITSSTTEQEGYRLLDNAIYQGTGASGVLGFTIYYADNGVFNDILYYRLSPELSDFHLERWLQYIWQTLFTFGCLITVPAVFGRKTKRKGKPLDFRDHIIKTSVPHPFYYIEQIPHIMSDTEKDLVSHQE
jgi:hypothetical protein